MELIDQLYSLFQKSAGICTDSRKVTPGCLFFGLSGGNVDGSAYGAAVIDAGAIGAIVRKGYCEAQQGVVFVEDPLAVLQVLAAYHRRHLSIPVLGITGSNGKTTTKELVHRVLSQGYNVRSTEGNLNNHIGVPLTLLAIKPTDTFAVVEMGANHVGEIAFLCEIARPTHGIVTNIGKAHLEGFGGLEGVKKAKSELYDWIAKENGIALINGNEPFLTELSSHVTQRVFYGLTKSTVWERGQYQFISRGSADTSEITYTTEEGGVWTATSPLFGQFNVANMATAVAVGLYFGIPGAQIAEAIEGYVPQNNRAQRVNAGSNIIIMDAYNANPTSMANAIRSFSGIDHPKKWMILGAMMELGDYAPDEHLEIGRQAVEVVGCKTIFVGSQFRSIAADLGSAWFEDVDQLNLMIRETLPEDTLILLKGSRALSLERVLAALQ